MVVSNLKNLIFSIFALTFSALKIRYRGQKNYENLSTIKANINFKYKNLNLCVKTPTKDNKTEKKNEIEIILILN